MGGARFIGFYLLGGLAAIGRADAGRPERGRADRGGERRDSGGAGRLRAALSAGAGDHGRLHHHLLHDHRVARAGRARLLDPRAGVARRESVRAPRRPAEAEAWPTSRTSAASCSACWPSDCSPTRARGLRALPPPAGVLMAAQTAVLAGTLAIIALLRPDDRGRGRGRHQRLGGGRIAARAGAARIRRVRRAVSRPPDE